MRCAPARPVRACILRKWCPVSHVTLEAPLRTSHFSALFTLHTSHSTLHTSHCTLRTPSSLRTALLRLQTSHFKLHTSDFTLHTSHFSLPPSHSTLHTSHSTLHPSLFTLHSSCPTLHTALFTLHTSHSTLPLIWALLTLSQLISSHLISSHMSSKLSWITSQYYFENLHAPCASQARACVLCAKLLHRCCPRTWPARGPGAMQGRANAFRTLRTALFALHTPHFTLALHTPHFISSQSMWALLTSSHLSSSHLIPSPLTCNLRKFFSTVFISFETLINLSHLLEVVLNSSQEGPPESQIFYTYQIFQLLPLVLFLLI